MSKWITCNLDDNELLIDAKSVMAIYKNIEELTLEIWLKGAKGFLINYQSIEELNKSYNDLLEIVKKY